MNNDSWFAHNTDRLLLLLILIIGDALVVFFVLKGIKDHDIIIWALTSASNILGALLMILTGRSGPSNSTPVASFKVDSSKPNGDSK